MKPYGYLIGVLCGNGDVFVWWPLFLMLQNHLLYQPLKLETIDIPMLVVCSPNDISKVHPDLAKH